MVTPRSPIVDSKPFAASTDLHPGDAKANGTARVLASGSLQSSSVAGCGSGGTSPGLSSKSSNKNLAENARFLALPGAFQGSNSAMLFLLFQKWTPSTWTSVMSVFSASSSSRAAP